jgi:pimeloyl-ACP methyl ester carboxylesterase
MPFVTANRGEFHYAIDACTDPSAAPDTIWIQHGVGRSGRFWDHWVPPLARNYHVLRRDQRGHGLSPDPGPDFEWTIPNLLRDMVAFLDALKLDSVHYIGESMGAILGVAFASRWPDRLKSLTLCSMPVDLRPPQNNRALNAGFADSAKAKRELGAAGWAKELIRQRVISGGASPGYTQWVIDEIGKTPTEVLVGVGRPLYTPDANIADLLGGLKVPTLVLAPTNSPITSLDDQNWIRDRIPNARIAVIDGPTHEIYVDRPLECLAAVEQFLGELDRSVQGVRTG